MATKEKETFVGDKFEGFHTCEKVENGDRASMVVISNLEVYAKSKAQVKRLYDMRKARAKKIVGLL